MYINVWRTLEVQGRPLSRVPVSTFGVTAEVAPHGGSEVGKHTTLHTHTLDRSIFQEFNLCSINSLKGKTALLVDLAACLVAGCECASGIIAQAQTEGATPEEIARVGCIVACSCGLEKQFTFLAALKNVESWKPFVKEMGRTIHNP
ncbi:MAG: carboxymuconolactone decarboxylase family protein [Pyrinomonadaceae bacterium]